MKPIESVPLEAIQNARKRISDLATRTPLVRLNLDDGPADIYLKLENLQPIGSFKLRGAGNALLSIPRANLQQGVYTASAGNMAQGVAWVARKLDIPCSVVVPDHAPRTKLDAIARLGGRVIKVSFDEWWQVLIEHRYEGLDGFFIHPVSDAAVIAGNGTIGLEIMEDMPDLEAVVVPFGGGGLISGIASALRSLKPHVKVFASEVETAAPLSASLKAGHMCEIDRRPSFVDGIGGKSILEEMWPIVSSLVKDSLVVSLAQVADAIRMLIERNRVVAEGAGASSVAAALTGGAGRGKVVCIVSGGNIDAPSLLRILGGEIPK